MRFAIGSCSVSPTAKSPFNPCADFRTGTPSLSAASFTISISAAATSPEPVIAVNILFSVSNFTEASTISLVCPTIAEKPRYPAAKPWKERLSLAKPSSARLVAFACSRIASVAFWVSSLNLMIDDESIGLMFCVAVAAISGIAVETDCFSGL